MVISLKGLRTTNFNGTVNAPLAPIAPVAPLAPPVAPLDINAQIAQARAMVAQTQAQGATPFSYQAPAMSTTNLTGAIQPLPVVAPTVETAPPIPEAKVEAPPVPTPATDAVTNLMNQVMAGNNAQVGRGEYQAEQNQAFGVNDTIKDQNDLVAQITQLQNQSKALQNEANYTIPNEGQVDSEGRGRTKAGLAPLTASALRKNQIKQGEIASQALTYSSTLAALQGKLLNAQALADQAVALKFGRKEEQLKADTANLQILLQSPDFTKEEKAVAQALIDKKQLERDAVETQRDNAKQAFSVMTTAAQNTANFIPSAQYPTPAVALNAISNATPTEAVQIASETGLLQSSSSSSKVASIQEYEYAKSQGYTGTYNDYQNVDANRKASIARAGVSGLTPSQVNTTVNSIAGAFDNEPLVKEYNTINRAVQTFNSLGGSATDDIQRVYTFAKIADPTSSVKEGEYDSIEKYSQALLRRSGLKVSRVFSATGILTPEARTAMSKTIQASLDAAQSSYEKVASEYQRQVDDAYAGKPRQITNYQTTPVAPVNNEQNPEDVFNSVVGKAQSSSWIVNAWNSLFK